MAGSYIQFNDGVSTIFDNGLRSVAGGVGSRFANWTPNTESIQDEAETLGGGQRVAFAYGTIYEASFDIENIPQASLDVAMRLKVFLESGGIVSVYTGDSTANAYTAVKLAPKAKITLRQTDRNDLFFSMSFRLRNTAATPMLCVWP